jgi:hypothetical protein
VWEVSADPIRAFLKKNNEELVARDDDGDASAFAGIGKTLASE